MLYTPAHGFLVQLPVEFDNAAEIPWHPLSFQGFAHPEVLSFLTVDLPWGQETDFPCRVLKQQQQQQLLVLSCSTLDLILARPLNSSGAGLHRSFPGNSELGLDVCVCGTLVMILGYWD